MTDLRQAAVDGAHAFLRDTLAAAAKHLDLTTDERVAILADLIRAAGLPTGTPDSPDHRGDFEGMRAERDKWLLTSSCHCVVLADKDAEIGRLRSERDRLRTACRDLIAHAANIGHWSAIRFSHGECSCDDCTRADNALEAVRYARAAIAEPTKEPSGTD